uniref:Uncharacterized protein n=1 Tax=virus sp. ctx9V1 TaxID=2828001 RepID=A0A8S5RDF5_9VIRU|nr:MAG TPA: hypothetical protein [virus sp. ctx9V1]
MIAILLTICLLISTESLVPIHLDRCLTKQFL